MNSIQTMKATYNKENKIYTDKISNQLLNGGSVMIEAVKCNDCQFIGEEDDLEILKNNTEYFRVCPNCKTDECLMDVKTIKEVA